MALYGDTSGRLTDHQIGGDQNLTLDDHIGGTAYGLGNPVTPVSVMLSGTMSME